MMIQYYTFKFVINGKDTDDHKIQYFLNSLKGKVVDQFAKYETTHPTTTWNQV